MVFSINSGSHHGGGGGGSKLVRLSVISFSTTTNRVQRFKIPTPVFRTLLTSYDSIRSGVINVLLRGISDLPTSFIDGRDCSMVPKISGMLQLSLQGQRIETEHCSVYVAVYNDSCRYNVKLGDDEGDALSGESVRSLAEGEGSKLSFPAGATAIERERDGSILGKRKREEEEENCAICFEGFDCGTHEMGRLPCSHVYHTKCILQWFVRGRATCPLCCFPCSD